ncbi:MAG TPA: hypothetical protein VFR85_10420 [Anaeromyxobacteraceae bacterium]|nr:hypothetical protein [Anaeromyxobacteraceae bacterium]
MRRLAVALLLSSALAPPVLAQAPATGPDAPPQGQAPAVAPASPPPGYAPAQKPRRLELTAFAGYEVSSDVTTSTGTLQIDDAPGYGVALDWALAPGKQLELLWVYSTPDVRLRGTAPGAPSSSSFQVDAHYFQLGGLATFGKGNLEPFASGSLGAAMYVPGTIVLSSGAPLYPATTWRFAFSLGGGVKFWLGDRLGLRLQARLLAPVLFSGGAFYSGPGGSALTVSGGIPYVQGDFTIGLTFAP